MTVDSSRESQVGQGEERSSLTHISTIEMVLSHFHARFGISLPNFHQFGAGKHRKPVFQEKIFQSIHVHTHYYLKWCDSYFKISLSHWKSSSRA